ncbi:MAG: hypothetical protein JNM51_12445 [Bacteroidia bacterium]|nr:hypothetical protein [Bacteroidia bacterium]
METIQFTILINTNKQKVWNVMFEDKTYRQWTTAFHEGSFYKGSWETGSEIHFLGPDEEGNLAGMYSKIKENRLYDFISIEHLGMIRNGIVDTTSEEVKKWTPAYENYTFTEKGNQTELKIEMQVDSNYKAMFEEMWPRALKILKDLSEQ